MKMLGSYATSHERGEACATKTHPCLLDNTLHKNAVTEREKAAESCGGRHIGFLWVASHTIGEINPRRGIFFVFGSRVGAQDV